MIGAQSGKWYFYDGNEWIQSSPPSIQEGKAICIYCGFENKITAEACARCGGNIRGEVVNKCPKCGHKLDDPSQDCPSCTQDILVEDNDEEDYAVEKDNIVYIFRGISHFSLFNFCGFLGLIIGAIFGAFTGVTDFFSDFAKIMPNFLQPLQGKLFGGIVLAGLGGIAGFIVFGILGFILALIINLFSSLVGGVKIKLSKE